MVRSFATDAGGPGRRGADPREPCAPPPPATPAGRPGSCWRGPSRRRCTSTPRPTRRGESEHPGGRACGGPRSSSWPTPRPTLYVDRYGEPDKAGSGLGGRGEHWPVPYWIGDAAFGVMAVLLGAVDAGLGACILGTFRGEAELARLGVPEGGGCSARWLGHPDGRDHRSPSLDRPGPTPADASTGAGGTVRRVRSLGADRYERVSGHRSDRPCRKTSTDRGGDSARRDFVQTPSQPWRAEPDRRHACRRANEAPRTSTTRTASTVGGCHHPVQHRRRGRSSTEPSWTPCTPRPTTAILDVGVTPTRARPTRTTSRSGTPTRRLTATSIEDASHLGATHPGLTFVQTSGDSLPFEDGQFDIAFSTAVIEHVGDRERQRQFWPSCSGSRSGSSSQRRTVGTRWSCTPTSRSCTGFPSTTTSMHCARSARSDWATTENLNLLDQPELRALFPAAYGPPCRASRLLRHALQPDGLRDRPASALGVAGARLILPLESTCSGPSCQRAMAQSRSESRLR